MLALQLAPLGAWNIPYAALGKKGHFLPQLQHQDYTRNAESGVNFLYVH